MLNLWNLNLTLLNYINMNEYIESLKNQNKLNLSTDLSLKFNWPFTKIAGPCSVEGPSILKLLKK